MSVAVSYQDCLSSLFGVVHCGILLLWGPCHTKSHSEAGASLVQ